MSFNPKVFAAEHLAAFEAALKAAYERGVSDGIERIVAAARAPTGDDERSTPRTTTAEVVGIGDRAEAEIIRRAPRGLVPKVVGQMLADHPGKIIAEYEQMKNNYDNRISEKSVGNELRRHEGKKYRRNDEGEWFPMSGNKEAGDGQQTNSPASDYTNQGIHDGTALGL